jgi:hypothetical protein
MEPVTIAASVVVPLLVRYAQRLAGVAGKVVDEALTDGLRALWNAVRNRMSGEPDGQRAMAELALNPADRPASDVLTERLEALIAADPSFASEVRRLVADVKRIEISHVDVTESGAVALGGDVNISGTYAVGRDLHLSSPPGTDER